MICSVMKSRPTIWALGFYMEYIFTQVRILLEVNFLMCHVELVVNIYACILVIYACV